MKDKLDDIKERIDAFLNDMAYSISEAIENCDELLDHIRVTQDALKSAALEASDD